MLGLASLGLASLGLASLGLAAAAPAAAAPATLAPTPGSVAFLISKVLSISTVVSPLYPPGPAAKFFATAASVPVTSSLALPIDAFSTEPGSFVALPTSCAS